MKAVTPKTKPRATKAGRSILQGAREALAFAQGARDGYAVHVPATINVKAIREKACLSRDEFARRYGFSKAALSSGNKAAALLRVHLALFWW